MRIDLLALMFSPATVEGTDAQCSDPKAAEGFLSAMNQADSALNELNPVAPADAPQPAEPDQSGALADVSLIPDLGIACCCAQAQAAQPLTECSAGAEAEGTGEKDEDPEKKESVETAPTASTPSNAADPSPVEIPAVLTAAPIRVSVPAPTPPAVPPQEASQGATDSAAFPEEPAAQTSPSIPVVRTPSGIALPAASRHVRTPLFPVPGFARALEVRSEAARTVSNSVPPTSGIGGEVSITGMPEIGVPIEAGSEGAWIAAPQIEESGNPAEAAADSAPGDVETTGIIATEVTAEPATKGAVAESGKVLSQATPVRPEGVVNGPGAAPALPDPGTPLPSRRVARKTDIADEAKVGKDGAAADSPSGQNSADVGAQRLAAEVLRDRERIVIFTPAPRGGAVPTAAPRDAHGVETQKEKPCEPIAPSLPMAGREPAPAAGLFERALGDDTARIETAAREKQEESGDSTAARISSARAEARPAVADIVKRECEARKQEPEALRPVATAPAATIKMPREVYEPRVQEKWQGPASPSATAPGQVVAAAVRGASSRAPAPVAEAHPPEFIIQLAQRIQVQAEAGGGRLRIQLRPANLGRVEITAEPGVAGVVARIVTESSAVRQYLEGNLHVLERALTDQGLRVDRLDVVMQSFDFRHSTGQQQQAGSSGTHHDRVGAGPDGRAAEESETIADPFVLNVLGPNSTFHTVA